MKSLRIATRKSPLALWQAEHVKGLLQKVDSDLKVTLVKLQTKGDKSLDTSLARIGGKGLFIKELELALKEQRADIAVHSLKDLPAELSSEFTIAAILPRDDPRDVFISNQYANFQVLPKGAIIGTSSLRRQCQLLAKRNDLCVVNLRGNVGTRLQKLDEGLFDAIILAASGLHRLNLEKRITNYFSCEEMLPAVGQAALAIECLQENNVIINLVKKLDDAMTRIAVSAERAVNYYLKGGCQVPLAAFAEIAQDHIQLQALVGHPAGDPLLLAKKKGKINEPIEIGRKVAEELVAMGAQKILDEVYQK